MVDVTTRLAPPTAHARTGPRIPRWFGVGLVVVSGALVLNTLIGPSMADIVDYPLSETLRNETIGLEIISAVLVAPLGLVAGLLSLRGDWRGSVLALGPMAYIAYMFVQYVAGLPYLSYSPASLLHLAIFTLSAALLLKAWLLAANRLPVRTLRSGRRWAVALALLSTFVVFRWMPAFAGMVERAPIDRGYREDPGMYWTIFLLDLGVVVPTALVTAVALWLGLSWARPALYAVLGWFALVPPSVTAMGVVKHLNDDPFAPAVGNMASLVAGGVVFAALAVVLYLPLFRRR